MANILQAIMSLPKIDFSDIFSYLRHTILIPRLISLHGLALNPTGDSFHFTFTIPYSSSARSVKTRFFELYSGWGRFQHVKEIGDIEIWRIPRIEGAKVRDLDGELQKIFRTRMGRYLEAFTELVLQGVRLEDEEIVEEEQEGVVEFMFIVPGRELYDLFYDYRPPWLLNSHNVEELDELTAYKYHHFSLRGLKKILHPILNTPPSTRINIEITHLHTADTKHFRTFLITHYRAKAANCDKLILKLPMSKSSKRLLECNMVALKFVAKYTYTHVPTIYGYTLDEKNPLGTAYALIEGLTGTELQTALLYLPLPEQAIGSLYQENSFKWNIGPIVQKSLLEPPGTWSGLGLTKGERGPWTSVEAYYSSLLKTFMRWSKKSRQLHRTSERSENIEALLQLLPLLLGKIHKRFWKLTLCFPYKSDSEGFVVIRPLFHNTVFDLPDDLLEEVAGKNELVIDARIDPYCILFRRLFGHLEADCSPPERVARLGRDLTATQREWDFWEFGVDSFAWRSEVEMRWAWKQGERDGAEELLGLARKDLKGGGESKKSSEEGELENDNEQQVIRKYELGKNMEPSGRILTQTPNRENYTRRYSTGVLTALFQEKAEVSDKYYQSCNELELEVWEQRLDWLGLGLYNAKQGKKSTTSM